MSGKRPATGSGRQQQQQQPPKRLRHAARREHLVKPAIRRMARRAGVKRMGHPGNYARVRQHLRDMLAKIVENSARLSASARRKTITSADVHYVLAQNGLKLYGDGAVPRKKRLAASAQAPPARDIAPDDDGDSD